VPHHVLGPVVSSLGDDIRLHALDKPQRRVFVENVHGIDAAQREQHPLAVFLAVDRSGATLEPTHRGIAVQTDDEVLPQRARLFKVGDMADVQDVETPVGED